MTVARFGDIISIHKNHSSSPRAHDPLKPPHTNPKLVDEANVIVHVTLDVKCDMATSSPFPRGLRTMSALAMLLEYAI